MKRLIAAALAYPLFYLGDGVSRVLHVADFTAPVLYPIYNRCMSWSYDLHEWGGLKLWGDVE